MHQFCARCGADQTQHSVLKAKHTRRTHKIAITRIKPVKRSLLAFTLLSWAFLSLFSLPFRSSEVFYVAHAEEVATHQETLQVAPVIQENLTTETIPEKIERISDIYGVNHKQVAAIIQCESHGSTTVQSTFTGRKGRELSFGLAQIHISVHDVTYAQATDPDFAIDFLAKHWKAGHRSMWYNCSKKLGYI